MQKSILAITVLVVSLLFLYACQQNKSIPSTAIVPPIEHLNPLFHNYTFDAADGFSVELPSSTKLCIPENAFIDATGNKVNGDITIQFRVLPKALDIWLSGIPMEQEINGQEGYFQTAGTFELRAFKEQKQLRLGEDKAIDVTIASNETNPTHELFQLDQQGMWQSKGKAEPQENTAKKELNKAIKTLKSNLQPFQIPLDNRYFLSSQYGVLDIFYFKTGSREYELAYKELVPYNLQYKKMMSRQIITYQGKPITADMIVWKNKSRKPLPEQLCHAEYKHLGGNKYFLTAKSRKYINLKTGKEYETWNYKDNNYYPPERYKHIDITYFEGEVEAVISIEKLLAQKPNLWQKIREKVKKEIREKEARQAKMKEVLRTFEVDQLGIYNWDILLKKEGVELLADFNISTLDSTEHRKIYCFFNNNTSVISFTNKQQRIKIPTNKDLFFVSVVSDKELAIIPKSNLKNIDFERLSQQPTQPYSFDFEMVQIDNIEPLILHNLVGI